MNFAHWDALPAFNLDAAFRAYLLQASAARGRYEFDLATLQFMALFRNGHTAFDDVWLWNTYGAAIGIDVQRLAAGWFVTASAHTEVQPGSRVMAVDDEPIDTFFRSRSINIAASSEREAARRLFSRPYLFPLSFRLTLEDGFNGIVRRGEASLQRSVRPTSMWIAPDRIRLLRIPSFELPAYEAEAVEAVRELGAGVHLIIDVRGNGGGDTPVSLVRALMTRQYRYWHATTPVHVALCRANGCPPETRTLLAEWHDPDPEAFPGRLAILVDGGTFSAAEDFVVPFKDNGRAPLVGETTGGSSGQPYLEDFDDGMRCWIGSKRQYFPDGSEFEGRGIEPDVVIPAISHDFRDTHDRVVNEAIWLLGNK